jgi:CHAP domain-containing protein
MMKFLIAGLSAALGGALGVILLVVVIVIPILGSAAQQNHGGFSGGLNSTFSAVADAALVLENHVSGARSNEYSQTDPFMSAVIEFWRKSCPGTNNGICSEAVSGNLQCVEFVTAAQWLAGDPLTVIRNGGDFWPAYSHLAGWQEIPSPSNRPGVPKQAPQPGDLMIWQGGEFGHIAVVVHFQAPTGTKNGSVTVAEGNAPGNRWPSAQSTNAGNTYTMPVHPDYTVSTWSGFVVLGYIRRSTPPKHLSVQASVAFLL